MIYLLFLLSIFIWPFGQLLAFSFPGLESPHYFLDLHITGTLLLFSQAKKSISIRTSSL
jgi:hypothetical protein